MAVQSVIAVSMAARLVLAAAALALRHAASAHNAHGTYDITVLQLAAWPLWVQTMLLPVLLLIYRGWLTTENSRRVLAHVTFGAANIGLGVLDLVVRRRSCTTVAMCRLLTCSYAVAWLVGVLNGVSAFAVLWAIAGQYRLAQD